MYFGFRQGISEKSQIPTKYNNMTPNQYKMMPLNKFNQLNQYNPQTNNQISIPNQINNNIANNANLPLTCPPNEHAQQIHVEFGDVTFDSCFDSGNLAKVEQGSDQFHFNLWTSPDCAYTQKESRYRTWFYFKVCKKFRNETLTFTIKNLNFQARLYKEGMLPVCRSFSETSWRRISTALTVEGNETGCEITFSHRFPILNDVIYFAFSFPFSYSDNQEMLDIWEQKFFHHKQIYFHRENLCYSLEKRNVDIVTITSHNGKQQLKSNNFPSGMYPDRQQNSSQTIFENKKYVVVSARVHPGEIPGTHVLNGMMKFLLSNDDDPRISALLENFVFLFVPFLNPDGVYRGHYRSDPLGQNLNRFYASPNMQQQPSIFCLRELCLQLSRNNRLHFYLDLHAHASKKGAFFFGNSLEFRNQVEACLFPKLVELNCEGFDYELCNFSEKNMHSKDKDDNNHSKDGCGRVGIYKATNCVHCYTLEVNYNAPSRVNTLVSKGYSQQQCLRLQDEDTADIQHQIQNDCIQQGKSKKKSKKQQASAISSENIKNCIIPKIVAQAKEEQMFFEVENMEEMGLAICVAVLDYYNVNPHSRIQNTPFKSTNNLKLNLACQIIKQAPYRFDNTMRKIMKNISNDFRQADAIVKLNSYLNYQINLEQITEETIPGKPLRSKSVKYHIPKIIVKTINILPNILIPDKENKPEYLLDKQFKAITKPLISNKFQIKKMNYGKNNNGKLSSQGIRQDDTIGQNSIALKKAKKVKGVNSLNINQDKHHTRPKMIQLAQNIKLSKPNKLNQENQCQIQKNENESNQNKILTPSYDFDNSNLAQQQQSSALAKLIAFRNLPSVMDNKLTKNCYF